LKIVFKEKTAANLFRLLLRLTEAGVLLGDMAIAKKTMLLIYSRYFCISQSETSDQLIISWLLATDASAADALGRMR
jgi:hypothetical protein